MENLTQTEELKARVEETLEALRDRARALIAAVAAHAEARLALEAAQDDLEDARARIIREGLEGRNEAQRQAELLERRPGSRRRPTGAPVACTAWPRPAWRWPGWPGPWRRRPFAPSPPSSPGRPERGPGLACPPRGGAAGRGAPLPTTRRGRGTPLRAGARPPGRRAVHAAAVQLTLGPGAALGGSLRAPYAPPRGSFAPSGRAGPCPPLSYGRA